MDNSKKKSNGQLCAILCLNPDFGAFLKQWVWHYTSIELAINSAEECKKAVYWLFEIESRSELNQGANKSQFLKILKSFNRWKRGAIWT